jgi:4'-phosphopantetheinyl transferase
MARAPDLTLVHALLWRDAPGDAMLQHALAGALHAGAHDLTIARDDKGKPFIAAPQTDLQFSLSHASGFQLLAWTHGASVGADLETADGAVAELHFTPAERTSREPVQIWTMKEAVAKARGDGMPGMARFEVGLAPARVVAMADDDPAAWRIWTILPQRGLVAAIAVRAPQAALTWRTHP